MKQDIWTPLAKELQVPWRSAEAMHWALGEEDMARRAGSTLFTMAAAGSTNPANVSSSSSASGTERYGLPEPTTSGYSGYDDAERASEEGEIGGTRHRRSRADTQQTTQGQQLAPVGQGFEVGQGGYGIVLPSLAELTGGVPAQVRLSRERGYWEGVHPGSRPLEREHAGQSEVKPERRGSQEEEIEEQEPKETRRQH